MILTIWLTVCIAYTIAQPSLDDCAKTVECFTEPANCKGNDCAFVYKWSNNGDSTNFELNAKINGTVDKVWVGIGFSETGMMPRSLAAVCKYIQGSPSVSTVPSVVEHYYLSDKNLAAVSLLNAGQPSIGLSTAVISQANNYLKCTFTRKKAQNLANYYDLSKPYYLLAAYGFLDDSNALRRHSSRFASKNAIDFTKVNNNSIFLKAGIMLNFALIILGIILFQL